MMIWILLASQLSLPVATQGLDIRAVFSPDDMPAEVQIAGITRFVGTRTTVRPDGKLQDCVIERASGDAKLDAHTCAIIMRRAKVRPATWIDGSPAYGVVRMPVTWAIGESPSRKEVEKAIPADVELSVTNLPKAAHGRASLQLLVAAGADGTVLACEAAPPNYDWKLKDFFPELVPVACEQLKSQFKTVPARNASGQAVRSVQSVSVSFGTN
jgi:TonB family protein